MNASSNDQNDPTLCIISDMFYMHKVKKLSDIDKCTLIQLLIPLLYPNINETASETIILI